MPEWLRQTLALTVLFGGCGLLYLWLGVPGAAGFCAGISAAWLTIGIASGYWIGTHGPTDQMVTGLMRRIKERRGEIDDPH